LEYFYKNKSNKTDGLNTWCKRCAVLKSDKWAKDNPERRKELLKRINAKPKKKAMVKEAGLSATKRGVRKIWAKNNPDKIKEYTKKHRIHDITEAEWRECLKVFEYKCAYCGITEEESKKKFGQVLHKEHVDHKGYNDLRNAVPSCKSCNDSKRQSSLDEWYKSRDFYNEEKYNFIIWWISNGYKKYIENKPPYRIVRRQNEGLKTFHFQLWTVDEMRNMLNCIRTSNKKKELDTYAKVYFQSK
jgi:5-methylcytosine-specific restriction endonuclease McrA